MPEKRPDRRLGAGQCRVFEVAGHEQMSSYVGTVLRGTGRLLLVSGLFCRATLAWCFAVDSDLVTAVQWYRRVAAADDGGMPGSRVTMAAWDRRAPTSVTMAAAQGEDRRPAGVGHELG